MRLSPFLPLLPVTLVLAGCATAPVQHAAPPARAPVAAAPPEGGLGRAMGQDATALIAAFGRPALDLREGPARKLQFRGPACVLDAYLYPAANGGGPARVTWLDARTPTGGPFDRASCVAALGHR